MSSKAITIYTPPGTEPHIAAQDDAFIYDSILGGRSGILGDLECALIDGSKVRLSGGGVSNRGYILWVPAGENCELNLTNGVQGFMRHDIVAAQFTKGTGTSPDRHVFLVIRGAAGSTPSDPSMRTSQLLNPGDINQVALFRVIYNDLSVTGIERIAANASDVPIVDYSRNCLGTASHATTASVCTGNAGSASTAAVCTGNSLTASRLQTSRKISLTGDAVGNVMFDGSQNVALDATVRSIRGHTVYIQSGQPAAPDTGDIWMW